MNISQNPDLALGSPEKWLTTSQVIELLDISRSTLFRLVDEGKLELVQFNGNKLLKHKRIRFSAASVERLMIANDYDECLVNKI